MRIHSVKKARKSPGKCFKCGKDIPEGEGYIWWKFRRSGKYIRCGKCPRPRPSELTESAKVGAVMAAQESVEDALQAFMSDYDLDTLKSAMDSAAEEIRNVAEEYRESAQNIEDGFQHRTSMCDELEEKADNLESGAEELESVSSGLEEFDEDGEEGETEEKKIERRDDWASDTEAQVNDAIGSIST